MLEALKGYFTKLKKLILNPFPNFYLLKLQMLLHYPWKQLFETLWFAVVRTCKSTLKLRWKKFQYIIQSQDICRINLPRKFKLSFECSLTFLGWTLSKIIYFLVKVCLIISHRNFCSFFFIFWHELTFSG